MLPPTGATSEQKDEVTAEQRIRAARLRNFNIYALYLPTAVASLAALALFIWLMAVSLGDSEGSIRTTTSGVADALVVLATLPAVLICGVIPSLLLAAIVQGRKRGLAPVRSTQRLLWRLDRGMSRFGNGVNHAVSRLPGPIIRAHARGSFVRTWLHSLWSNIKRS